MKRTAPTLLGWLSLLGALGLVQPAHASTPALASNLTTPTAGMPGDADALDPDDPNLARQRPLGLMFDLGSMHGGMLSLLYRPAPWLRVHAGAGTNAVSPGYRAGVTIARAGGGPSLNIEGGHFLPGDMNGLLKVLVGTEYRANARLEHFDYDFINLHAGWELESGNLVFFARGGVSALWTTLPALPGPDATDTTTPGREPFRLLLPSIALGFIGFL